MKRIVFITALIAICAHAWALPARRGAITLTQPDGSPLTAYMHGDAHYHYLTDAQNNQLEKDASGFYRATEPISYEEALRRRESSPRRIAQSQHVANELNLAPRGLVILVNFKDLSFQTSQAEMDSMLNGLNYKRTYRNADRTTITAQGSARQYFHDVSMGQYNPVFDVVGPVTVSQNYSYYGKNDILYDQDQRVEEMIKEACELVDDEVDFTLYDNNNDGKVDFVYVYYAGYSESDGAGSNYIWPHNYNLSYTQTNCVVDGLKVDNYACSNELDYYNRKHDGIGTFCHEFSHVLGLPDLYVTESGTQKTLGSWDILDYGPYNNDGNTPPAYSAYERFFMGWLKPTVINQDCDIVLYPLHTHNTAALISSTGTHNLNGYSPSPTTFYLLENRQKEGWDAYLPGHGMLITRIKYSKSKWENNTVNNSRTNMGVDIIEADGLAPTSSTTNPDNGYMGKPGDAYPAGSTSFTAVEQYQITDIEEYNWLISFKVNGGGNKIVLDVEDAAIDTPVHSTNKIIKNGMLLIQKDGIYYDLLGNKQQ